MVERYSPYGLEEDKRIQEAFKSDEAENAIRFRFDNVALMKRENEKSDTFELVKELMPYCSKVFSQKIAIRVAGSEGIMGKGSNSSHGDFDEIKIEAMHQNMDEAPDYIFHELGHSLEKVMKKVAKEKNLSLPKDTTHQSWADLCACFVLRPEMFARHADILVQETFKCLEIVFEKADLPALRKKITELVERIKQKEIENYVKIREQIPAFELPEWMQDGYVYKPFTDRGFEDLLQQSAQLEK